jgi:hypothetical protein
MPRIDDHQLALRLLVIERKQLRAPDRKVAVHLAAIERRITHAETVINGWSRGVDFEPN